MFFPDFIFSVVLLFFFFLLFFLLFFFVLFCSVFVLFLWWGWGIFLI